MVVLFKKLLILITYAIYLNQIKETSLQNIVNKDQCSDLKHKESGFSFYL